MLANFLKAMSAPSELALSKKLVAMGDGWTTTTSMPRLRTSGAMDVANIVMKALVLAYMELSGLGTKPWM